MTSDLDEDLGSTVDLEERHRGLARNDPDPQRAFGVRIWRLDVLSPKATTCQG